MTPSPLERCNAVGVRIIIDAIINHMVGQGSNIGNGITGESFYDVQTLDFTGVPFDASNFNDHRCESANGMIIDYTDPKEARNCRFGDAGLVDLDQGG
jgi:alpha-amylase